MSIQNCSCVWSKVLNLFIRRGKCSKCSADLRLWGLGFFLGVAVLPFLLPTALVAENVVL